MHLYFVSMKHEQHISIMLPCGVSDDFLELAIPGGEIVFVQRMLVRGENSVCQMGEYVFFVAFAQSITFKSIIL